MVDIDKFVRHDLLCRLRWNILSTLSDIKIATGPHDQITNVPLVGHSLAITSLFYPPLSRIQVSIGICEKKGPEVNWMEAEEEEERFQYKPPAKLIINNNDGTPITLGGQFVTETHAYLSHNADEIKKIKGEMYGERVTNEDGSVHMVCTYEHPVILPPHIGIYVSRIWASRANDGTVTLRVTVYADEDFLLASETFWWSRLRYSSEHARQWPV